MLLKGTLKWKGGGNNKDFSFSTIYGDRIVYLEKRIGKMGCLWYACGYVPTLGKDYAR